MADNRQSGFKVKLCMYKEKREGEKERVGKKTRARRGEGGKKKRGEEKKVKEGHFSR